MGTFLWNITFYIHYNNICTINSIPQLEFEFERKAIDTLLTTLVSLENSNLAY